MTRLRLVPYRDLRKVAETVGFLDTPLSPERIWRAIRESPKG